jgi:hypothetical protein
MAWAGGMATAMAVATAPGAATAKEDDFDPGMSFSLHVDTYRPNIDSEFSGEGAYRRHFGGGSGARLRLDLGWIVGDCDGPLTLGAGGGWYRATGQGLMQDSTGAWVQSLDRTALSMIPVSAFFGYRWEGLSRRTSVPLAPFLRLGLERINWWTTDGAGSTKVRGATHGVTASGGLAISLDGIDPPTGSGRPFRTWLLLESTVDKVNDFGSKKSWDLSTSGWSFGAGLTVAF